MPVIVVVAPYDRIFEKTVSNMQEVAARGGRHNILITDETGARRRLLIDAEHVLMLPDMPEILTPLIYTIPLQLLAYHTAVLNGDRC